MERDAVKLKRARFKTYRKLVKAGQTGEAKAAKEAYNGTKRLAKRTVCQAKAKAEEDTFANISPYNRSVFKVAKQMDRTNRTWWVRSVSGMMLVNYHSAKTTRQRPASIVCLCLLNAHMLKLHTL